MGSNKRDLKAYVRYDGSGRVVAGSLILRRNKPKVGNWQEVQGYECCNQNQIPVLVNIGDEFPFTYPDFVLQGVGGTNTYLFSYAQQATSITDIYVLADALNTEFPVYGTFKVVDGDLYLSPKAAIAEMFTLTGATSLEGYTFAD